MERSKGRQATQEQVALLVDFMQDHSKSSMKVIDKMELEHKWEELIKTLNSMGGAVKTADKWKKTWADIKYTTKKRTQHIKRSSVCDTSIFPNAESQENAQNDSEDYGQPSKKRYASFDEEILKIERDKLDLDREYKVQKIEALTRIASALEEIARKKS